MPIPTGAPRLRRSLAREEAYAELQRWIVEGELAPGERIQDWAVAAALGVSRMPVREALLRLEGEGLVESSANRWIRVAPLSPEEGEEIYPVISSLECLAVRLGWNALGAPQVAAMVDANARLDAALDAADARAAHRADTALHAVLLDAGGNRQVARIVADLKMRLRRLEIAYFAGNVQATSSVEEHRELIEAIRGGDVSAALASVDANWRRSLDRYRAQLARHGGAAAGTPGRDAPF